VAQEERYCLYMASKNAGSFYVDGGGGEKGREFREEVATEREKGVWVPGACQPCGPGRPASRGRPFSLARSWQLIFSGQEGRVGSCPILGCQFAGAETRKNRSMRKKR